MTHNEAFIATCIEVTRMDGELSNEEMSKCLEVLKGYGINQEEFDAVVDKLDQFTEDDWIATIKSMTKDTKSKLLAATDLIARSDGMDSSEFEFINSIKEILTT